MMQAWAHGEGPREESGPAGLLALRVGHAREFVVAGAPGGRFLQAVRTGAVDARRWQVSDVERTEWRPLESQEKKP